MPSVLPGIGPAVIDQRIAYGVIGDGLSVVGGELVLPVRISIGIGDSGKDSTQDTSRIGVFFFLQDVPACIVGVGDGLACVSVVFPDDFA